MGRDFNYIFSKIKKMFGSKEEEKGFKTNLHFYSYYNINTILMMFMIHALDTKLVTRHKSLIRLATYENYKNNVTQVSTIYL